jgi:GH15 family glucan-1,4-alpha-glucosidase
MSYQPIENYGMIGNMRTVALVGANGSIDWFCYPRFDSPTVFGAFLDDTKGGRFSISPVNKNVRYKQFYWPSTNILITRFLLDEGIVEIEDFMPAGLPSDSPWYRNLCRRIRCVRGAVRLAVICQPAFNYGRTSHNTSIEKNGAVFKTADQCMALSSTVPLTRKEYGGIGAEFTIEEGDTQVFIFMGIGENCSVECPPSSEEAEGLFRSTKKFWQTWVSSCTYHGRWFEQVQRSALALKLLTYEPTGAIIASPTCSLPEVIGGERNWDYRYTWLRDAAFTVYGFLRIGFKTEAEGFMHWLTGPALKSVAVKKPIPPLLTIDGDPCIPELILDHWEGYRGSRPVRIGNDAVHQHQNDIDGELLDTYYLYNKYVSPISYDWWVKIRDRLEWVCENWQSADDGVWEIRATRQNFVYSKVMAWVALDRGIRLIDKRSFPGNRPRWVGERDKIYEEVMSKGWNEKRRAFCQMYDCNNLDASLLIMPLVFFMAPTDPRMLSTIDAILESPRNGGLTSGGLVYRYPPLSGIDGLSGTEGTFNMCSFWLVEALTRAGQTMPERLDQALLLFERILGYANPLGLYAEQTGPKGEALGNFPQAFTHLALISAAYNLNRVLGGRE